MSKKIILFSLVLGGLLLIFFFFFKSTSAQVCLPLNGYLVWPGTWEPGRIPMASTQQYTLAGSPFYVSGTNVGLGTTNPVYTLQVNGDISGTRLCIGSDCRNVWPGGGVAGSGSAGQVAFWTGTSNIAGDNALFWDNTNKRLGIGTTTPQTSLHIIGNVTANTFLGTINAANVSSGQFGANTGGGNYSFMGNVGIGTTNPQGILHLQGGSGSIGLRLGLNPGQPAGYVNSPMIMWDSTNMGATRVYWMRQEGDVWSFRVSDTAWGNQYLIMSANSAGNVGIGTTTPQYNLDVAGTIKGQYGLFNNYVGIAGSVTGCSSYGTEYGRNGIAISCGVGTFTIGDAIGGTDVYIRGGFYGPGNLIVDGGVRVDFAHAFGYDTYERWFQLRKLRLTSSPYIEILGEDGNLYGISVWLSSEKAKKDIMPLEIDSSKIYQLKPVSFRWKEQNEFEPKTFGLIAEDVAKVIPELVSYDDKGQPFKVNYELLSVLNTAELQKIRNSLVVDNNTYNIGIGTNMPTSKLHIVGLAGYNQLRLEKPYTPQSSNDPNGNVGDWAWDDNFIYVKTSQGWKRAPLSSF